MERVQKARVTLDERLEARLELIYSYAKVYIVALEACSSRSTSIWYLYFVASDFRVSNG